MTLLVTKRQRFHSVTKCSEIGVSLRLRCLWRWYNSNADRRRSLEFRSVTVYAFPCFRNGEHELRRVRMLRVRLNALNDFVLLAFRSVGVHETTFRVGRCDGVGVVPLSQATYVESTAHVCYLFYSSGSLTRNVVCARPALAMATHSKTLSLCGVTAMRTPLRFAATKVLSGRGKESQRTRTTLLLTRYPRATL